MNLPASPTYIDTSTRDRSPETQLLDFRALAIATSLLGEFDIETMMDTLRAMDNLSEAAQTRMALLESLDTAKELTRREKPLVAISSAMETPIPDSTSNSDGLEQCSICLEKLGSSTTVMLNKCKHSFHTKCISEWFHYASRCPLCQSDLNLNDDTTSQVSMSDLD